MPGNIRTIGIIGAGKLGITLARIARHYGFNVNISGSGTAEKIRLTADVLAPGAIAMTPAEVARSSDVIILAVPLGRFRELPKKELADKLVIDAMNHWWEIDGERDDVLTSSQSSSEAVQEFLADSRVVKAFNHMGYHDLFDEHKPAGTSDRKAIALAGDDDDDIAAVSDIVNNLGFDPIVIGSLKEGKHLEPGTNVFGANVDQDELRHLVGMRS